LRSSVFILLNFPPFVHLNNQRLHFCEELVQILVVVVFALQHLLHPGLDHELALRLVREKAGNVLQVFEDLLLFMSKEVQITRVTCDDFFSFKLQII